MSRSLNNTVSNLFSYRDPDHIYASPSHESETPLNLKTQYMEIPITEDIFEVPTLALVEFFKEITKDNPAEALVVKLDTHDYSSRYASAERQLVDILENRYDIARLVRISVKHRDNFKTYYGTKGALFDSNFEPVVMYTYLLQRVPGASSSYFKIVKPIMRIDPHIFINKDDAIERLIANKLLSTTLYAPVNTPGRWACNKIINPSEPMGVKVEIEPCIFHLCHPDAPSISTTNQDILKYALDHLDEIMP